MTLRLLSIDVRRNLTIRRYRHPKRGVVQTVTFVLAPNVTRVGAHSFGGERQPAPTDEPKRKGRVA